MRIAVLIGSSSDNFVVDFIGPLSASNEVRISHDTNPAELHELCKWADIVWVEWAGEHAITVSRLPKVCPIILRLHSCEVFSSRISYINWNAIDRLIFVSPLIQNIFNSSLPNMLPLERQIVISNAINTDRFTLKKDFKKTGKIASVELVFDGNKNAFFAVQCFYELLKTNRDLTLHFTGRPGTSIEHTRLYIALKNSIKNLGLESKVFLEGNIAPEKMNNWLEDKDYIISTSQFESFGASIAEAMSKGIMPLLYSFVGARQVFPDKCIFDHISQCSDIYNNPLPPQQLRDYIVNRYSLSKVLAKILICINNILEEYNNLIPQQNFVQNYWENRYKTGGNSGAGSYGRLAQFKAEIINDFVEKKHIKNVLEIGCGDGAQLSLANYPVYYGFDISASAIEICKNRYSGDNSKHFAIYEADSYLNSSCEIRKNTDLALSLDVIFHLVEDEIFEKYMTHLFCSSNKYVIIYSSNFDCIYTGTHERHRKFTKWVKKNLPEWKVIKMIKNKYPYNPKEGSDTSNSDFYFFEKRTD